MTADEQHAICIDAEQRLAALHREHRALWADRDDALVMSELTIVESQMRSARQAIASSNA